MKKCLAALLAALMILLCGCARKSAAEAPASVLATTAPVAELASALLEGTDIVVTRLISGSVSCLHDYTLSVSEMKTASQAKVALLSGFGLEEFMRDALSACETVVEVGTEVEALDSDEGPDPHIWLAPENMAVMAHAAAASLSELYPHWASVIASNEAACCEELSRLQDYGETQLQALSCRKLITFHDGFSYFAQAFGLEIAASMELEPGSEPSARDLETIIALIRQEQIPAIFVEANGTRDAAEVVAAETGVKIYTLSMAMDASEGSYPEILRQNIDTVKEALG